MSTEPWWARFPFPSTRRARWSFESGDLLVCYTDGITEPENEYGEMFGEERLIELVAKNAEREETQIIETVMERSGNGPTRRNCPTT